MGRKLASMAIAAVTVAALFAPIAEAAPRGGAKSFRTPQVRSGSGLDLSRSRSMSLSTPRSRSSRIGPGASRGSMDRIGSSRSSNTRDSRSPGSGAFPILEGLANRGGQGLGSNTYGGGNLGPIGDALRDRFNERYYDRHDPYEEMADAYRDAAIANAVVNVIGMVTSAAITADQQRVVEVAPAPRPVPQATPRTAHPQSAGYYETQKVLVQEGGYVEEQVWVPEYQDPQTGEIVRGHHETRARYVEPVYEYRPVWVPAQR